MPFPNPKGGPVKVDPKIVREHYYEALRLNSRYTKAQCARDFGVCRDTIVRALKNTKPRSQRDTRDPKKQDSGKGLQVAFNEWGS